MKPVRVLETARRDIEFQQNYYNQAQWGLGLRFSRSVAKTLRRIRSNPEAMQIVEKGIRRWPVESFPHGVLYSVEPSEVLVVSVFHPSQDPRKWKSRV